MTELRKGDWYLFRRFNSVYYEIHELREVGQEKEEFVSLQRGVGAAKPILRVKSSVFNNTPGVMHVRMPSEMAEEDFLIKFQYMLLTFKDCPRHFWIENQDLVLDLKNVIRGLEVVDERRIYIQEEQATVEIKKREIVPEATSRPLTPPPKEKEKEMPILPSTAKFAVGQIWKIQEASEKKNKMYAIVDAIHGNEIHFGPLGYRANICLYSDDTDILQLVADRASDDDPLFTLSVLLQRDVEAERKMDKDKLTFMIPIAVDSYKREELATHMAKLDPPMILDVSIQDPASLTIHMPTLKFKPGQVWKLGSPEPNQYKLVRVESVNGVDIQLLQLLAPRIVIHFRSGLFVTQYCDCRLDTKTDMVSIHARTIQIYREQAKVDDEGGEFTTDLWFYDPLKVEVELNIMDKEWAYSISDYGKTVKVQPKMVSGDIWEALDHCGNPCWAQLRMPTADSVHFHFLGWATRHSETLDSRVIAANRLRKLKFRYPETLPPNPEIDRDMQLIQWIIEKELKTRQPDCVTSSGRHGIEFNLTLPIDVQHQLTKHFAAEYELFFNKTIVLVPKKPAAEVKKPEESTHETAFANREFHVGDILLVSDQTNTNTHAQVIHVDKDIVTIHYICWYAKYDQALHKSDPRIKTLLLFASEVPVDMPVTANDPFPADIPLMAFLIENKDSAAYGVTMHIAESWGNWLGLYMGQMRNVFCLVQHIYSNEWRVTTEPLQLQCRAQTEARMNQLHVTYQSYIQFRNRERERKENEEKVATSAADKKRLQEMFAKKQFEPNHIVSLSNKGMTTLARVVRVTKDDGLTLKVLSLEMDLVKVKADDPSILQLVHDGQDLPWNLRWSPIDVPIVAEVLLREWNRHTIQQSCAELQLDWYMDSEYFQEIEHYISVTTGFYMRIQQHESTLCVKVYPKSKMPRTELVREDMTYFFCNVAEETEEEEKEEEPEQETELTKSLLKILDQCSMEEQFAAIQIICRELPVKVRADVVSRYYALSDSNSK